MDDENELPDPVTLCGILKGGPTLADIRGDDCQELCDELLTACLESDDYASLYARCMDLVEKHQPPKPINAETRKK